MTNFSGTIVMIKETINNLVGFINSLLPILLALMIATRKSSNSFSYSANSITNYYIYRKFHSNSTITINTNRNSTWNNIKNIRQSSNRQNLKIL